MIREFKTYVKESKGFSFEVNDIYLKKGHFGAWHELQKILIGKSIYVKRKSAAAKDWVIPPLLNPIFVESINYRGMRDNGDPILRINDKYELYLRDIIIFKEPKIILSKEDPYGEEDWAVESLREPDPDDYRTRSGNVSPDYYFALSRYWYEIEQGWEKEKKEREKERNIKKIDPYGEEVWNENINHSELDPYGEEDWSEPVSKYDAVMKQLKMIDPRFIRFEMRDIVKDYFYDMDNITIRCRRILWHDNGFRYALFLDNHSGAEQNFTEDQKKEIFIFMKNLYNDDRERLDAGIPIRGN